MSFQILDHGAKRKRHALRHIIAQHHITEQTAKAEKSKGASLNQDERRAVEERSRETLERRDFFRNH